MNEQKKKISLKKILRCLSWGLFLGGIFWSANTFAACGTDYWWTADPDCQLQQKENDLVAFATTNIFEEIAAITYCCMPVGVGYYSPSNNDSRYACTNKPSNSYYTSDGNGTNNCSWSCDSGYVLNGSSCRLLCGAGSYWNGSSCASVGTSYYSPASNDNRYSCPYSNQYTAGSGTGADSSADCLCTTDYYYYGAGCGTVGTGYYSPYRNNTRYSCTNKPSYSTYTSDGNGSNNCSWACDCGYYAESGQCYSSYPGYYSPAANNNDYACGSNNKYSTGGACSCTTVSSGYYSTGGTSTTRTGQSQCPAGTYCVSGVKYNCPSGQTSSAGSTSSGSCYDQCGTDLYWNGSSCVAVGTGNYSPTFDNSSYACTNKPSNSYYTGDGGGTNNCPWSCNSGYYEDVGMCSPQVCTPNQGYSCSISYGTGTKYCNSLGSGYGSCGTPITACDGGYYNSGSSCTSVGAGYYSSAGSTSRSYCSGGYYGSTSTNSSSTCNGACSAGCYCPTGSTSSCQNSCPAGQTSPAGSDASADCYDQCGTDYYWTGSSCSAVGTGYYSPNNNNTRYACSNKPANSYYTGDGGGSNSCPWSCSSGYYESGGSCYAQVCTPNQGYSCSISYGTGTKYCDSIGSGYGACGTPITACDGGYYASGSSCTSVGAGYYSSAGSTSRAACAGGYYGSTTTNSSSTCNGSCSAGCYCPAGSTSSCQNSCPAGQTSPSGSDASGDCYDQCGAGQYWNGSACANVGTGYYSPANNNTRYACAANSYTTGSGTGADSSADCACGSGYYYNGSCTAVGAGYYSPYRDDNRYQCSCGYYGSTSYNSSSSCDGSCSGGYYCGSGSTSNTQNACGTGNYCPSTSCGTTSCPTNSTTTTTTASALSQCLGGAGYYNCEDGTCNTAGAGYYSPANDNSRYACAGGYYGSTTTNSSSSCNGACSAGCYCPAGSTSSCQNSCPAGQTSPSGSDASGDCYDICGAGQYWNGSACADVGTGYYSPANNNTRYACAANSYTTGSGTGADSSADCACGSGYYYSGSCVVVGAGYYSPYRDDNRYQCSGGYYGSTTTNSSSTCNGGCTAGYYCPAGSTSATQNACGTGNYCPSTSSSPTGCPTNSTTTTTTASALSQCLGGAGYYGCADGTCNTAGAGYYSPANDNSRYNCAAGYYGSSTTNSSSTCNGLCSEDCYCPTGSTSFCANSCAAGFSAPAGSDEEADCVSLGNSIFFGTDF